MSVNVPTGDESTDLKKEEEIDPRCIVKFRPADDWEGEYGFDWFREGDYGEKTVTDSIRWKAHYKKHKIIGKYGAEIGGFEFDVNGQVTLWKDKFNNVNGKLKNSTGLVWVCQDSRFTRNIGTFFKIAKTSSLYYLKDLDDNIYDSNLQIGQTDRALFVLCFPPHFPPQMVQVDCHGQIQYDKHGQVMGYVFPVDRCYIWNYSIEDYSIDPDNEMMLGLVPELKQEDEKGVPVNADLFAGQNYHILDILGTPNYYVPYVSLFYKNDHGWGKSEAELKLLINSEVGVGKIVFDCDSGITCSKNGQQISELKIEKTNVCYEDAIKITLTKDFACRSQDAYVRVRSFVEGEEDGKLAGKLCVVKCVPKCVDIVMVPIKVRLNKGFVFNIPDVMNFIIPVNNLQSMMTLKREKDCLKKFFSQAHIIPRVITRCFKWEDKINYIINKYKYKEKSLDPTKINLMYEENKINIVNELEVEFNKEYPDLKNMYKLFVLDIKDCNGYVGRCDDIGSKSAIILHGPNAGSGDPADASHELTHCFGLCHSFSNDSRFTFKKYETSNIMDYPKDVKQISYWKWQWDEMRTKAAGEYMDKSSNYCV